MVLHNCESVYLIITKPKFINTFRQQDIFVLNLSCFIGKLVTVIAKTFIFVCFLLVHVYKWLITLFFYTLNKIVICFRNINICFLTFK